MSELGCLVQGALYMGNIDAKRDWGHARDYVEMMIYIYIVAYMYIYIFTNMCIRHLGRSTSTASTCARSTSSGYMIYTCIYIYILNTYSTCRVVCLS